MTTLRFPAATQVQIHPGATGASINGDKKRQQPWTDTFSQRKKKASRLLIGSAALRTPSLYERSDQLEQPAGSTRKPYSAEPEPTLSPLTWEMHQWVLQWCSTKTMDFVDVVVFVVFFGTKEVEYSTTSKKI